MFLTHKWEAMLKKKGIDPATLPDKQHDTMAEALFNSSGGEGSGGGEGVIKKIESLDTENMVVLRDLESGTYVLRGRFVPYAGADSTMSFSSSLLVNLIKRTDDTQVQIFYPVNNCVQYLKITDTAYERTNIYLNDLVNQSTT